MLCKQSKVPALQKTFTDLVLVRNCASTLCIYTVQVAKTRDTLDSSIQKFDNDCDVIFRSKCKRA